MPDVQARGVENAFKLTKVGVTGVTKPVSVKRPGRAVTLTATFDVFVDLPAHQRGSHLSRNLEAIGEVVDDSVRDPVPGLEDLAATIARSLLDRHAYATRSHVRVTADYFLEKTTPMGRRSLERYGLVAEADGDRGGSPEVRRRIGVRVVGMTACPCAMETIREETGETGPLPTITHNQRNITTLVLEEPEGHGVEADDLVAIVESSMSAPTFEILKRPDEGRLVRLAHENPRFVEDVVREVLSRLVKTYARLPDGVSVSVRSESEESIHKHNAVAERVTTLGELRA